MSHAHDDDAFQFCPRCGGALEVRELKTGEPARLVCSTCGFVFYLDAKVAVGAIVRTSDDRIVLVRRGIEPGYGRWVFPSGFVDRGEEIRAAARREAREESGLEVRIDALLNVYSYAGRAPIVIVYTATALDGALATDEEGLEVALFSLDRIPWDELAFRSTFEALQDYMRKVTGLP
jgi:ADP-ribose pyrophosphatase YjhB (NUDIX family)